MSLSASLHLPAVGPGLPGHGPSTRRRRHGGYCFTGI